MLPKIVFRIMYKAPVFQGTLHMLNWILESNIVQVEW